MNKRVIRLSVEVDSSVIESIEYNGISHVLDVKYKRGKYKGRTKHYTGVAHDTFLEILNAESIGRTILSLFHSDGYSALEMASRDA